ncbi:MAG: HD domain-containing phosphohydrolase [Candidatus Izemoplasmatales bacterium]
MDRKRVIVAIDDLEDNLISISALLKEYFPDVEIKTAQSGLNGLELIDSLIPDVILLDIYMPNMDGFQVCTRVKNNPNTKDIPVVIITANKGDHEIRVKALDCGAEAFLSKPIDTSEFIAQVRSMLKISEASRARKTENERLTLLVDEQTRDLRSAHLKTLHLMDKLKAENEHRIKTEKNLLEAQRIAKMASFEYHPTSEKLAWTIEAKELFQVDSMDSIDTLEKTWSFLHHDDLLVIDEVKEQIKNKQTFFQIMVRNIRKGKVVFFDARFSVVYNGDDVEEIKGTFQDVTKQVEDEQKLVFLSEHDYLTSLYNRMYFEEKLSSYDRAEYYPLSIVMADVNGLKMINDSFGHSTGDEILISTAKILSQHARSRGIAARLGGDEFVIIMPRCDEDEIESLIVDMQSASNEPGEHLLPLSVSYGYATKRYVHEKMSLILKRAEDDMYRHKITESSSMRSKSVDLILNALFAKSPREMNHSKRVSEICERIAKELYTNQNDINQIRIAGLLHDIGKIGIDEHILNKNGKLTVEEFNEVKKHSEIGYRILSSVNEFSELSRYVLEHHEKNDGTGYPNGLYDKQISKQAKIISVADAYDAMTSDRTYRKGLSVDEAVDELLRYTNTQFDQEIVKVFVEKVLKHDFHF